MRFFLDENETVAVLPPLRAVLFDHEFVPVEDLGFTGRDDKQLFPDVAALGFDAIITRDRNQLADPEERKSLMDNNLHWIGHREPAASGLLLVASISAAYLAALPHIIVELSAVSGPSAFHVSNLPIERGQRIKSRLLKL